MDKKEAAKIKKHLDEYNEAIYLLRDLSKEEKEKKLQLIAVNSLIGISETLTDYRW